MNCTDYTDFSKTFHGPGSGGLLNLPFQRPLESCRKFTSQVIEAVISNVTSRMVNSDLARLFSNAFPNTLDTTIQATSCLEPSSRCLPLTYVITGDINAMWLRDSANQLLPYMDYIQHDPQLKRLVLGAIYLQAQFINIDPYANAFNQPKSIHLVSKMHKRKVNLMDGVFERKWEIDSLASFIQLSHRYWQASGDDSFLDDSIWVEAVKRLLATVKKEQEPTFNETTGVPLAADYVFSQDTNRPTETQFLQGFGQPVKYTGMVKSLFRPSDDATVFTFFIPGNAMLSVELAHLSQMLLRRRQTLFLAQTASRTSREIREGIYNYGIINHPTHGKVFAYEVDGYGSTLVMDDANMPSLLSLGLLGFISHDDPIYQNTRKLVWSNDNPYFFSGVRGRGIGGPHVGLNYAWPMSQIVRVSFGLVG
ncbi:hypothetical protein BY458DRAFT_498233 [Sporodiniella umbellata]|nr:hypothetical protein BY458DRAFT_498233 [Sporodiniella umbellata]